LRLQETASSTHANLAGNTAGSNTWAKYRGTAKGRAYAERRAKELGLSPCVLADDRSFANEI
jgi:hypothetical protein